MLRITVPLIILCLAACDNPPNIDAAEPQASKLSSCEYEVIGTSQPPSSGTPVIIDTESGTLISANFFNSGAINPPYFDGQEFVSVCVPPADENGNRTATITTDVGLDNNFQIKAYPEFIVGTKFGNQFETSFRYYNNIGLAPEDRWPVVASGTDSAGVPFEFANLEYVSLKKGVGLPSFTTTLPEIYVTLDIEEINVVGSERDIMLESWFHDTSRNAAIIGNNTATNQPIANTLNNIVGVGHKHYPGLDNTLLEMMVHIAPLSPHDVSQSKNNPGQNQLTEIYSGKDFDGDGIDDHFDVDSHLYINSTNINHPKPGIYSSGIDNNSDGIDDADLLPVIIGEFAYSIWYGETFLAPIVIFSRETNHSLTNDFDPNTPDMNVSAEGEMTLPWHDFVDHTLYDIEPHLQALDVNWAVGINNPFPAMRSLAGAISGVEFGVEPQTNNPADQTYQLLVNKYIVEVDSVKSGLINTLTEEPFPKTVNDTVAPNTVITAPQNNGVILSANTITLTGSASDSGDSGFKFVRLALRSSTLDAWYDFSTSSFNGAIGNGAVSASLSNTTTSSTNWSKTITLAAGVYTLAVRTLDNAGNASNWNYRSFQVSTDNQYPESSITSPAIDGTTIPPGSFSFSGTATDSGDSGFSDVRLAIRNATTSQWYNFSTNSFNGARGNGATSANLSNTSSSSTNWSLDISLPTGQYSLVVRAIDNAGNPSNWNYRSFQVSTPDNQYPDSSITSPAIDGTTIPPGSFSFSGTATDSGDSGFSDVRLAIRNTTTSQWYNFSTNSFNGARGNGATSANLSNTSSSSTDWSLDTSLPTGQYSLVVRAIDNAGNASNWNYRSFQVSTDNQYPESSITSPAIDGTTIPPGSFSFSGTATDSGDSGFSDVRLAIRNTTTSQWYNFSTNSFNGARGNGATSANLSNTSSSSTNWSLDISLPTGQYSLVVRAIDNAGNPSNWNYRSFQVN